MGQNHCRAGVGENLVMFGKESCHSLEQMREVERAASPGHCKSLRYSQCNIIVPGDSLACHLETFGKLSVVIP